MIVDSGFTAAALKSELETSCQILYALNVQLLIWADIYLACQHLRIEFQNDLSIPAFV